MDIPQRRQDAAYHRAPPAAATQSFSLGKPLVNLAMCEGNGISIGRSDQSLKSPR